MGSSIHQLQSKWFFSGCIHQQWEARGWKIMQSFFHTRGSYDAPTKNLGPVSIPCNPGCCDGRYSPLRLQRRLLESPMVVDHRSGICRSILAPSCSPHANSAWLALAKRPLLTTSSHAFSWVRVRHCPKVSVNDVIRDPVPVTRSLCRGSGSSFWGPPLKKVEELFAGIELST